MKNVILMVDDNAEMRSVFSDLLAPTKLKVLTFPSVKEAQIYLINPESRQKVLAIVSDLMMGPTDGLEFLSYVKKNPDLAHIDFFLFTGADVSVFRPFITPFKLKGIIEKPFNRKALVQMLTDLLPASDVINKSAA
ncbi:MAG: hypothetical protein A2622_13620 [Bdellovibrionales bacterium RIFCSPHIGHO2_01_FULL_40_29]|nr:MAG: hypothetical protein A2622_13620 [Bdellovibrionales bacterium RIFCSPHIGHO2_01_FULL_40_29]OFZ34266.1 MAG: hypothetical protein A3D17_04330 [Bdellovibrionales bacterium RIFCSPHIGHO2_02_FULL_40_15]